MTRQILLLGKLNSHLAIRTITTKSSENLNKTLAAVRPTESLQAEPATLTDTFGRFHSYLRISLTERCNLRCKLSRSFDYIFDLNDVFIIYLGGFAKALIACQKMESS